MEKIAIIITVLHEELTLPHLLASLEMQTKRPDEVVIVDGGSTDQTRQILSSWKPNFSFQWFEHKGNRSQGRNAAISAAKASIIAITDAGCAPEPEWLDRITQRLVANDCDVVSGYYIPHAQTSFEKAAAAYMLVMPDHIHPNLFLPATRSMALKKMMWKKTGRFDERLSDNEDYAFAKKLQSVGAKICFERNAVVRWSPPKTWSAFLKQVWRFAYGDCFAGIVRPKVVFIFLRWFVFIVLAKTIFPLFLLVVFLYACWAWAKNQKHVSSYSAIYLLPGMQLTTDLVVMVGSVQGLAAKISKKFYAKTNH